MRAIEFRAWANNTMYYFVELTSFKDGSLSIDIAENGFHDMHTASGDVVLMQYTGLKDAKGNKVYEGDIIRESHHVDDSEFDVANCIVDFDNGSFVLDFRPLNNGRLGSYDMRKRKTDKYRQHIVIGNKYQHGELLNEQKTANIGTDKDG